MIADTRLYKRYGADAVSKPLPGSCIRAYRTDCSVRVRCGIAMRSQRAQIEGYRTPQLRPSGAIGVESSRESSAHEPTWHAFRMRASPGDAHRV